MEDVCKESIASMIKTPEDALKGLYEMVVEFRALLNYDAWTKQISKDAQKCLSWFIFCRAPHDMRVK